MKYTLIVDIPSDGYTIFVIIHQLLLRLNTHTIHITSQLNIYS